MDDNRGETTPEIVRCMVFVCSHMYICMDTNTPSAPRQNPIKIQMLRPSEDHYKYQVLGIPFRGTLREAARDSAQICCELEKGQCIPDMPDMVLVLDYQLHFPWSTWLTISISTDFLFMHFFFSLFFPLPRGWLF